MSDSLAGQLDAGDAVGWKPEEGDLLIGEVVGLSRGWSDYKDAFYPIVTIKPNDGSDPVAVHGFQFVLEDRFTALKPMVGEEIGIKVGPKVPTKDGKRSVQTYTVKMNRSEDIWSDLTGPRQQAAPVVQTQTPAEDEDIPF